MHKGQKFEMAAGIATLVLGFIIPVSLMLPGILNAGRSSFWILAVLSPSLLVFLGALADCCVRQFGTGALLLFFVLVLFCVNGYVGFFLLVLGGPMIGILALLPLLTAVLAVIAAMGWRMSEEKSLR